MDSAPDMFSKLPDELLSSILSLIPIKEAVRCSVLSKRWRYLYTQMPQLTFSPYFIMGSRSVNPNPLSVATVENIISNILLSHSCDLQSFYLSTHSLRPYSQWQLRYQSVMQWVQCAARKKVKNLGLCHSSESVILVPAIFSCTLLRTLLLSNYIVSHIPLSFSGFNHLTICHFFDIDFRNDSLSRFISHCPRLENLQITNSAEFYYRSGPQKLIISAPNITIIAVEVYNVSRDFEPVELLAINCPKLEVFSTNYSFIKDLRVNGLLFKELSFAVQRLEMQCGSNVIGLSQNSTWKKHNLSAERFLDIMAAFKLLKKLSVEWVARWSPNLMKIPLLNLLQTLPRLEHLDLTVYRY